MYYKKILKIKQVIFHSNKELAVSLGVILFCLLASLVFPAKNSAQLITKNIFFLVLFPISYIKIILKKNISDFGWNLKNPKAALPWTLGIFFFTLLVLYFMLSYSPFGDEYKLPSGLLSNFWLFLGHEMLIVNFILFINAFFFQGFILSAFQEKFNYWAIAIQSGFYLGFLLVVNSFSWQTAPFILFSITGSVLAYKTKSFFYSYFINIFAIIILDTYIIYLTK